MSSDTALIVVDAQCGFRPGGGLLVAHRETRRGTRHWTCLQPLMGKRKALLFG